jgi:hypothetical protein
MRQTLEFSGKNEKSWCKNPYLRAVTGLVTRRKIRSPLDDTSPAIPWSGLRIRFAAHTFDELGDLKGIIFAGSNAANG